MSGLAMAILPPRRIRPRVDLSPGIDGAEDEGAEPEVVYEDEALRVVMIGARRVVEVPDGRDAVGNVRWQRARLLPERQADVVLEGWKEIARELGVNKLDTVLGYTRREKDPLPVRVNTQGKVWIFRGVLKAWAAANTMAWKQRRYFVDVERKRRRKP